MKTALVLVGSGLIGVITLACGLGWVTDGGISGRGGFVNIIAVLFWVLLINWIDDGMKKKERN